jgi:hypothetical protein
MPLIGKRLKRKNLKTLTVKLGAAKAKPVRKAIANKKRIIFLRFAKMSICPWHPQSTTK